MEVYRSRQRGWREHALLRPLSCSIRVVQFLLISGGVIFASANSSTTISGVATETTTSTSSLTDNVTRTLTSSTSTSSLSDSIGVTSTIVDVVTTLEPNTSESTLSSSNISVANETSIQTSNSTFAVTTANPESTTALDGVFAEVRYSPNGVCVRCEDLSDAFLQCEHPSKDSCNYGEHVYGAVRTANATCTVLEGITCFGPGDRGCSNGEDWAENETRTFVKEGVPCIKYSKHQLLSSLLVSVFFGILGADRFSLGWTRLGLAKLFTLSMLGVWWIVDIALLAGGHILPADGSLWAPFY
eukprot:m.159020 g.159020  ORF g.159020 m.159020 type:complete len:300 (+) comp17988_c0_seq1:297-1196(+)